MVRLMELGLFSLEEQSLRGYLISIFKYLKRGCKEDEARIFSVLPSDRTRGSEHKMEQEVPSEHQEVLIYCEVN